MNLLKKIHHTARLLSYLFIKGTLRLLGFIVSGTILILLLQFMFPDYIRFFNEDITEKSARKLLDNYKYNELLWLLEQKQPTLDKMKPMKQSFFHYMKGEAYSFIGEYQKSEAEYQRMADLFYQQNDKGTWKELTILQPFIMFNFRIGNYEESLKLCEKALELFPKLPPKLNKQYNRLGCYLTMMNIYARQGRSDEILKLMNRLKNEYKEMPASLQEFESIAYLMKEDTVRARKVWDGLDQKALPPAFQLSGLYSFKEYDKLRPVIRQYLKETEKVTGTNHPLYAEALYNAIPFDMLEGNYEEAYQRITQNNRILNEQFDKNFIFMSERQQQFFHSKYHSSFDLAYALQQLSPQPEWADLCYNNALFVKGILLRSQNRFRNSLSQSGDTTLLSLYDQWISLKQSAASLKVSTNVVDRVKCHIKEEEAEKLAKELSLHTEDWQKQERLSATDWTDVQKSLSEGEAAIEFVVYGWQKQTWYAALVLQPNMSHPVFVPLFNEKDLSPDFVKVEKTIWQAISPYLQDSHTLYFSPAGQLHAFPLAFLETGTERLTDRYRLYRVSSTREIRKIKEQINYQPQRAVLFGGLQYDASDEALLLAAADSSNKQWRNNPWNPLRYSGSEISRIGLLMDSLNIPHTLHTGLEGNEEAFKRLDNNPVSIIHLSTHGYFLPDDTLKIAPMLRSGLILSGGNRAWENKDILPQIENGLLTAEEIAAMRLPNTRLVVLSACNTGLGAINNSEGIFGLQRAFKLAGAQTLIMSLWPVDDRATSELMFAFYRNWLTGTEMHLAFTQAQNEIRLKYPEPYYWAGFVMLD